MSAPQIDITLAVQAPIKMVTSMDNLKKGTMTVDMLHVMGEIRRAYTATDLYTKISVYRALMAHHYGKKVTVEAAKMFFSKTQNGHDTFCTFLVYLAYASSQLRSSNTVPSYAKLDETKDETIARLKRFLREDMQGQKPSALLWQRELCALDEDFRKKFEEAEAQQKAAREAEEAKAAAEEE